MQMEVFGIQIHSDLRKTSFESWQKMKIAAMLLLSSFLWAWIGRWFAVEESGNILCYYLAVAVATLTSAFCLNALSSINFTRFAAGETGRKSGYKWGTNNTLHRIEFVLASRDGMIYRFLIRPFLSDPTEDVEPYYVRLHRHEIALMAVCEERNPTILPIREGMGIWVEEGQIYISVLDESDRIKLRQDSKEKRRLSLLSNRYGEVA